MKRVLGFDAAIATAQKDLAPNHLALYVYELANAANTFYESVPVMKEDDGSTRLARLFLVAQAAKTIKRSLEVLGIPALAKM